MAQVHAAVLGDPSLASDAAYAAGIKLRNLRFDPQEMGMEKKREMVTA